MEMSQLRNYHLLPGVRGDFLSKLGRHDEARAEFVRGGGDDAERAGEGAAAEAGSGAGMSVDIRLGAAG